MLQLLYVTFKSESDLNDPPDDQDWLGLADG